MKPVQIPSFMSIGTTGNEESLMHGSDQYDCIDTVVVKGCKYFVHKSGPVSCGLNSSYLGYIMLMYGWSQSISAL